MVHGAEAASAKQPEDLDVLVVQVVPQLPLQVPDRHLNGRLDMRDRRRVRRGAGAAAAAAAAVPCPCTHARTIRRAQQQGPPPIHTQLYDCRLLSKDAQEHADATTRILRAAAHSNHSQRQQDDSQDMFCANCLYVTFTARLLPACIHGLSRAQHGTAQRSAPSIASPIVDPLSSGSVCAAAGVAGSRPLWPPLLPLAPDASGSSGTASPAAAPRTGAAFTAASTVLALRWSPHADHCFSAGSTSIAAAAAADTFGASSGPTLTLPTMLTLVLVLWLPVPPPLERAGASRLQRPPRLAPALLRRFPFRARFDGPAPPALPPFLPSRLRSGPPPKCGVAAP